MEILNAFNEFETSALNAIAAATDSESLEKVRIEFLGQKNGRVKDLQKVVGTATPAEKPAVGKRFNEVRTNVTAQLDVKLEQLKSQAQKAASDFDHRSRHRNALLLFFGFELSDSAKPLNLNLFSIL